MPSFIFSYVNYISKICRSFVLKPLNVDQYPRSIPLTNTPSTPWLTLDRQLINISIDSCSIIDLFSIDAYKSADSQRLSPNVDEVSIKCQPSINWNVDQVLIKMLTRGIKRQWIVDAITTHDPNILQIFPIQNFLSSITKFSRYSKHWLLHIYFISNNRLNCFSLWSTKS